MKTLVSDEDNPGAIYLVVVEAPGQQEVETGRPFIGKSGQMLFTSFLSQAGIVREQCYITNVLRFKPPCDFKDIHRHGIDVNLEYPRLKALVLSREWSFIFVVGGGALKALTWKDSITSYHGSLLYDRWTGTRRVFPMIHPAAMMRQDRREIKEVEGVREKKTNWMAWTFIDMAKLRHILHENIQTPPKRNLLTYQPGMSHLVFVQELDRLCSCQSVAFDIETFRGTVTAISFAGCAERAISVPLTGQFSLEQEVTLLQAIDRLLRSPAWKIAHNCLYDIPFLYHSLHLQVSNMWLDTMVAHHILYPELPHGLEFLCAQYTLQPYYKDMRKEVKTPSYSSVAWEYNALDACIPWEAGHKILCEMLKEKLWTFYERNSLPLLIEAGRMAMRGISVDVEERDKVVSGLNKEIATLQKDLETISGQKFNANSTQQTQEFLYNVLGLPQQKKRSSGSITTDKNALLDLLETQTGHSDKIQAILSIREKVKLRSFLISGFDPDGKMRTSYRVTGTVTGRLSSAANIWGRGTNLQNIPKKARRIFIASPGKVLFGADLRQAEDRVVAFLAEERLLIEAYNRGIDTHKYLPAMALGKQIEDFTDEERYTWKHCRYLWNYGGGPLKMMETARAKGGAISLSECERVCRILSRTLPNIVLWRARVRDRVRSTRKLYNCHGRRRIFYGMLDDKVFMEAYAQEPQSTVGDHMNFSLRPIGLEFPKRGLSAVLLLQIHDALVGECLPEEVKEVEKIVRQVLERPLNLFFGEQALVIPTDFKVGKNWEEVS